MRTPALGLLALAIACSDPQGPEISGEYAVHPGLGEPFVLEVGERALIAEADLDVRFLEVSADSRCPSHALTRPNSPTPSTTPCTPRSIPRRSTWAR
jgi:hypothetical protein